MKLILNNKIFIAKYNENGKLIIPLQYDYDKIFFKKWQDKTKNSVCKKDYVINVEFVKVTERGILISCFPILSINEDFVELIYDRYILKYKPLK